MSSATVSIIVPTYNRKEVLKKALEAYSRQTKPEEILEILVIDDGSTDGTVETVSECAQTSPPLIRYLGQENMGLAAARNHGIREARGELVLFADDDIIPASNMVEEHVAWHKQHPDLHFGVIGYAPWSPELRPTPLMQWSIYAGPQFSFGIMSHNGALSKEHLYFCNTSLKLRFLRENGLFDEGFRRYGWEDWDLGYRLQRKGLVMMYHPRAVGYHYKRMSFEDLCHLRRKMAASQTVFWTREAGRAFFESQRRRQSTRKYRLERLLVKSLVPCLFPLKPLLDSRIPLPWVIYRAFYVYYGVMPNEWSGP